MEWTHWSTTLLSNMEEQQHRNHCCYRDSLLLPVQVVTQQGSPRWMFLPLHAHFSVCKKRQVSLHTCVFNNIVVDDYKRVKYERFIMHFEGMFWGSWTLFHIIFSFDLRIFLHRVNLWTLTLTLTSAPKVLLNFHLEVCTFTSTLRDVLNFRFYDFSYDLLYNGPN